MQKLSGRNQLMKLALVNCSINDSNYKVLESLLKTQRFLIDIDISWNQLMPHFSKSLLTVMAENRRLQFINLAWNNITNSEASEEDQNTVLTLIGTIIKRNKNILHMDLTSCGLTEFILIGIGNAMRKARSLLAIHLSGNDLGVTDKSKQYIRDRVRCRPQEDIEHYLRV